MPHTRTTVGSLLRDDWFIVLLLVADGALALWARPMLPAIVPTHWGIDGTPDAFGPATINLWLLPGIAVCIYFLMLGLSAWAGSTPSFAVPQSVLRFYRVILTAFFLALHGAILVESATAAPVLVPSIRLLIPLLLYAIASTFRALPQNPFIGIRLPWTLFDTKNWRHTHDRAAVVWKIGSVLSVMATALPPATGGMVFLACIITMVFLPIIDSYLYARRTRTR